MIQIHLHRSGKASVIPDGWLGDDFWTFKDICTINGAKALKEKGQWINLISLDHLGKLINALKEGGFECELDPNVLTELEKQTTQATEDKEAALERLHAITEELAKVNRYPFPFQIEDILVMAQRTAILNANPMGSGKTMEALLALPNDTPTICIVPAVVKENWADEIRKWRLEEPEIRVLYNRQKELELLPGFTILNYDILPPLDWLKENFSSLVSQYGRCGLVFDEAHMLKNPKAQRTEKCREMAEVVLRPEFDGRVLTLTGTPMDKAIEVWNVLRLTGLEKEAFGSWNNFCRLFNGFRNEYGWEFGEPVQPDVNNALKRVMIRREKEDILPELPDKRVDYVSVNKFDKKALSGVDFKKIQKIMGQREPTFEELSEVRAALAAYKIPAMLEYVEQFESVDEPLVVASAHRAPIDALAKREGWGVITGDTKDRKAVVDAFQAGRLKGVGLTIQAGGVGITLTRANHMLFVDEAWSPKDNEQARDRIHRIGQKNMCRYMILVSSHPVDTRVAQILAEKHRTIYGAITQTGKKVQREGYTQRSDALTQTASAIEGVSALSAAKKARKTRTEADTAEERAAIEKLDQIAGLKNDPFLHSLHRQYYHNEGLTSKQWELLISQMQKLHKAQTPKQQFTERALARLCALDPDGAAVENDVGFNKLDSHRGKKLYAMTQTCGMDDDTWEYAYGVIRKYHRQIGEFNE